MSQIRSSAKELIVFGALSKGITIKIYDHVIVGAGLFGSVIANKIATESDHTVLVVDKRKHIGGNCYSETDQETGIEFHKYGPHIFHTNYPDVWHYVNQFSEFSSYSHRVLATYKSEIFNLPINLFLINKFFGVQLTPEEAKNFIAEKQIKIDSPRNFEELALSTVGNELYEAFFKQYTGKQWGRDPKTLPAQNFSRLPVRYSYNDRYFSDTWCGMPLQGYTKMFERMLDLPNITVMLDTDYATHKDELKYRKKLIYTGSIDQYFDHCEGRLSYRGVELASEVVPCSDYQGTAVMNYPEAKYDFTRIIEPKHFHEERTQSSELTLIQREYPREDDGTNPSYPVNDPVDVEILSRYHRLAQDETSTIFGGRLGMYKYLNMDQVIKLALQTYEEKIRQ